MDSRFLFDRANKKKHLFIKDCKTLHYCPNVLR